MLEIMVNRSFFGFLVERPPPGKSKVALRKTGRARNKTLYEPRGGDSILYRRRRGWGYERQTKGEESQPEMLDGGMGGCGFFGRSGIKRLSCVLGIMVNGSFFGFLVRRLPQEK